jgi:hypothetical protein
VAPARSNASGATTTVRLPRSACPGTPDAPARTAPAGVGRPATRPRRRAAGRPAPARVSCSGSRPRPERRAPPIARAPKTTGRRAPPARSGFISTSIPPPTPLATASRRSAVTPRSTQSTKSRSARRSRRWNRSSIRRIGPRYASSGRPRSSRNGASSPASSSLIDRLYPAAAVSTTSAAASAPVGPDDARSIACRAASRNARPVSAAASRLARPRLPPASRAARRARTSSAPSRTSSSTTNASGSAVNAITWHRDRTVSGSSCARADSSNRIASAGGSSSTFSSVSAAWGDNRSASRITKTLRPGSGAVRYAGCQTSARIVSTWMSRPSGSTRNSFG